MMYQDALHELQEHNASLDGVSDKASARVWVQRFGELSVRGGFLFFFSFLIICLSFAGECSFVRSYGWR